MSSRWLAWVVLGATAALLALVGVAGVRQIMEPSPPDSLAEVAERIEAAGITCGGATTAQMERSTLICGDDPDALFVTFRQSSLTVSYSGSYVPLKPQGAERGELSGDRFSVLGPYETLLRVQKELGGHLQPLRWP